MSDAGEMGDRDDVRDDVMWTKCGDYHGIDVGEADLATMMMLGSRP